MTNQLENVKAPESTIKGGSDVGVTQSASDAYTKEGQDTLKASTNKSSESASACLPGLEIHDSSTSTTLAQSESSSSSSTVAQSENSGAVGDNTTAVNGNTASTGDNTNATNYGGAPGNMINEIEQGVTKLEQVFTAFETQLFGGNSQNISGDQPAQAGQSSSSSSSGDVTSSQSSGSGDATTGNSNNAASSAGKVEWYDPGGLISGDQSWLSSMFGGGSSSATSNDSSSPSSGSTSSSSDYGASSSASNSGDSGYSDSSSVNGSSSNNFNPFDPAGLFSPQNTDSTSGPSNNGGNDNLPTPLTIAESIANSAPKPPTLPGLPNLAKLSGF